MRCSVLLAVVTAFLLLPPVGLADVAGWNITQITDNDHHDNYPRISGTSLTWEAEWDIYHYDGHATHQLTDSTSLERYPRISGSNVVWQSDDGSGTTIYLYEGSSTSAISRPWRSQNWNPEVSGDNVVWGQSNAAGGTDGELFLYDGSALTQLTSNGTNDFMPFISGSNVAWSGEGGVVSGSGGWEIFFWDGTAITQVTHDYLTDSDPRISGSHVVWEHSDGHDFEVALYDHSTGITTPLTSNDTDDLNPQVSGGRAVWMHWYPLGWATGTWEVDYYDGATTIQLADHNFPGMDPQISGTNVVWTGWDGSDYEIYLYEGLTGITQQLTDNAYSDGQPQIDGSNITWMGYDGNDTEIFLATPGGASVPELPPVCLAALGLLPLGLKLRRRRK